MLNALAYVRISDTIHTMPRIFDYEKVAAEWLRQIRGRRSQVAFSRRLRYKSNVVYLWESCRNWPTAAVALWAVSRTGVDVRQRLGRFFREPPSWLAEDDPCSPQTVTRLLNELRGNTPIMELARRMDVSRFAAARWLKGEAQPRLPDFFRFVEAASLRLLDFLALFVDPAALSTVAEGWAQLQAARRLGYDQPWAQAVFLALQLEDYKRLPTHQPGWVAQRLGLSLDTEQECLALLERAGYVRTLASGLLEAVRVQTVDTRSDPAASRKLRHWWAGAAVDRLKRCPDRGMFAYNIFTISHKDFERLQQLQRNYFRTLRTIVAASEPAEHVVLTNLQLLALDSESEDAEDTDVSS